MKNILVYTAISGDRDLLKDDQNTKDADFLAFVENTQIKSNTWKIKKVNSTFDDPVRNAKIHKLLYFNYFPEYEYNIWIDGSIKIDIPASDIINQFLKDSDLAVFKHPVRNCLYKEAEICKELGFDDPKTIDNQIKRYKEESFPENFGLIEGGILIRRNTPKVREFFQQWWNEVENGSRRDQISFPYVLWKSEIKLSYVPGTIMNIWGDEAQNGNEFFSWFIHHKY